MAKRQAGGSATTTATAPSSGAALHAHVAAAAGPCGAGATAAARADGHATPFRRQCQLHAAAVCAATRCSGDGPAAVATNANLPDRRQMSDLSAQERAATIRAQRLDESQYDRTRAYSGIPGARSAEERNRERRKAQEEEDPYGRPAPPDFGVTGRYRVVTPGSLGPTRRQPPRAE